MACKENVTASPEMPASEQQLAANRSNAAKSTGPKSSNGKAIVSTNAIKHAILSDRMLVDGEKPAEFRSLLQELGAALAPVGIIEAALVERIAISLWRQRRLVRAETAALSLATEPRKIAAGVSQELDLSLSARLSENDLVPFDRSHAKWCEGVIDEFERMDDFDLEALPRNAPLIHRQLKSDADSDNETVEAYLGAYNEGLSGYLAELIRWCRKELEAARQRPKVLQLAEHFRARNLVLPVHALQLFTRYQTTLDNQLFKSLRALREAQEWRLKQAIPTDDADASNLIESAA
jgi:hypothetical protein